MTVRELVVKFGFEVDRQSQRNVERSIRGLKDLTKAVLAGVRVVFQSIGADALTKDLHTGTEGMEQAAGAASETEESMKEMADAAARAGREMADAFREIPGTIPAPEMEPVPMPSGNPVQDGNVLSSRQEGSPVLSSGMDALEEDSGRLREQLLEDAGQISEGYGQLGRAVENVMQGAFDAVREGQEQISFREIEEEGAEAAEEIRAGAVRAGDAYRRLGGITGDAMQEALEAASGNSRQVLDAVRETEASLGEMADAAARAEQEIADTFREIPEIIPAPEIEPLSVTPSAVPSIPHPAPQEENTAPAGQIVTDLRQGFAAIAEESGSTVREVVSNLGEAAEAYEQLGDDAETAMRKAFQDLKENQKLLSLEKIAEQNGATVERIKKDLEQAAEAYEQLGMDAGAAMERAYNDIVSESERAGREIGNALEKASDSAESTAGRLISAFKKAAGIAAAVFASGQIVQFGRDCIDAAAEANATASQFEQVFGDMESAAQKSLQKISDDTGVAEKRMTASYTKIAAFAKTTGMETADALSLANRSMAAVADSAAFYDRSMEDVTETLQSFLKGNYENDAALGLSCTETTRNAAANALYGKSFKDLSEAEKQLALLTMVEDANRASGALGQAARESDTLENQMGNLKQAFFDLKSSIGQYLLEPFISGLKLSASWLQAVTDKVQAAADRMPDFSGSAEKAADMVNSALGKAHAQMERVHALVKRLQPAAERFLRSAWDGTKKAAGIIMEAVERLGGIENVLKILAVAAGAFLTVMNWTKITSGARAFVALLSSIGKLFSGANLSILGIVAAVAILFLVIEDFIHFLMGNDSLTGEIFDRAGIGADNARKAVFDAFGKVKDFLVGVFGFLKTAAGMFVDTIGGFFEKHGESIRAGFERTWGIIRTFLSGVWTFLSQLASVIFGGTENEIAGSAHGTKDVLLSVWQSILNALSAILDALFAVASAVLNAIAAVVETVFGWIQSFWEAWGPRVLNLFKTLWDSLGGILMGFLEIIQGVADFVAAVFTGDWAGAWEAVKSIFTGIWDVIVNFITAVWETIKLLFSMALSAIQAVWNAVWSAVSGFFQEIWNGMVSFVAGVWNTITSTISNAVNTAYHTIVSVLQAIHDFFSNIFSSIASLVSRTFSNMLNGVINTVASIKDAIVNGFSAAVDFIKELPGQAVQWGADFIGGLKDGIMSGVQGIVDAVKGIGDKIRSFLHFSVPDEGPLTDYESWMPDFMGGLAKGIRDNKGLVLDSIKELADGMAVFVQAAKVQPATIAASTVNNTNQSSVTQVNNFNNTYHGTGNREEAKSVTKGMKKSASDATAELAKALEFSRG